MVGKPLLPIRPCRWRVLIGGRLFRRAASRPDGARPRGSHCWIDVRRGIQRGARGSGGALSQPQPLVGRGRLADHVAHFYEACFGNRPWRFLPVQLSVNLSAAYTSWRASLPRRPVLGLELLALLACMTIVLIGNGRFWRDVLSGHDALSPSTWLFALCTGIVITVIHLLPLAVLSTRTIIRPLILLLALSAAMGGYFMDRYGIVLDPGMMRNVLNTNPKEAFELMNVDLLLQTAPTVLLTAMALAWIRIESLSWRRALRRRLVWLIGSILVALAAAVVIFKDVGAQLRIQHQLRYTVMPVSALWSLARAQWQGAVNQARHHAPHDAVWRLPAAINQKRPLLLVMVVGETVRADHMSLLGYGRETNPELRNEPLIAYPRTRACGTATEVSLPCMFSAWGRRHYDEDQILSHDSILQTLGHAGIDVTWRDNQSGCKGVCDGLNYQQMNDTSDCRTRGCLDEVLLDGLAESPTTRQRDEVIVLHQMGNHGPAYYRRYPPAFARFQPACQHDQISNCTREEIINAYDNALLYTDHIVARLIKRLRSMERERDVAMIYVADHGESLGEFGLYLHGMPYATAPESQLHVPMLWWIPPQSAQRLGLDMGCLARRAQLAVSHDNLYHTMLGMTDTRTQRYDARLDLLAACRMPTIAGSASAS